MTYSGKDKYKSRYFIQKGSGRYKRWQQRYKNSQEWAMNKKNSYESKSDNIQKKPSSRRNYIIEENLKKQHKRISSIEINRKK